MSETKPIIDAEVVGGAMVPYQVNRLGAFKPAMVVNEAVEIADCLKDVIKTQGLFTIIGKGERAKAYVHLEGWSIVGGMMGIFPIEASVIAIEGGYEATIDLIRARDDKRVGRASSICTRSEYLWKERDEYAIRSMAITRATSKAYRLSYGWLIKLAGFDPMPVEEAGQLAQVEALAAYQAREAEQLPDLKEQQQRVAESKVLQHDAANAPKPPAESSTPILVSFQMPKGNRKFAIANWNGIDHSVWDSKLFDGLQERVGKPVILYTAPSADKKYSNVLSFELPALQQSER